MVFGVMTPALSGLPAAVVALGLALEGAGLVGHPRGLNNAQSEGAASFYAQVTRYGYPYWLRNGLLVGALLPAVGLADMRQLGVVHEHHHPFRLDELVETIDILIFGVRAKTPFRWVLW